MMARSIHSVLLVLLLFTSNAFGNLQVVNEWPGGYLFKLQIPVAKATNGWRLELKFQRAITNLEAYNSKIESIDGAKVIVSNESYNKQLIAGNELSLDFLVRYYFDGAHRARVRVTEVTFYGGQSVDIGIIGQYDYGEVIGKSLLFYEAQRCGKLPPDNRIPWRGDSFLQDGADNGIDLTGGYFDAGDHVKFGFPAAAMTTVMAWGVIEFSDGYKAAGQYENVLKALRWSLDYFMKAHTAPTELYGQVGDGNVDHAYWGRPEDWPANSPRPSYKINATAPGSDLAGETAAAFAAGFLVFRDVDYPYAAECLRHAQELYDFANQYRGLYSDSITNAQTFYKSWGYGDELAWAAAWLYRATGDHKYLEDVRKHWNEFYLNYRPDGFGWDNKVAGLQVLLAEITKDATYVDAAQSFCDHIANDVKRTPKGLAFLGAWGSLRSISNAAFVCLVAGEKAGINTQSYRTFAKSQMGYILGDTGRSFVVGYGVNPPSRPHHRASSCPLAPQPCETRTIFNANDPNPETLTGALVGGPDGNDAYTDTRNDYVQNEVALDYNAGFQGVLAGLNQLRNQGLLP